MPKELDGERRWSVETNRHRDERTGDEWGEVVTQRHPAGGAGTPAPGMRLMWSGEDGKKTAELIRDAVNAYDPEALAKSEAWAQELQRQLTLALACATDHCECAMVNDVAFPCSLHRTPSNEATS